MLNLELAINFAKRYIPNWSEEVSVIKKPKILCPEHNGNLI